MYFDINRIFSKREEVEDSLRRIVSHFSLSLKDDIGEAFKYVLMSEGKRIRPILGIMVLEIFDSKKELFIDILSIIEVIHTYSLIHDDLPCMDNDDMRRGNPTLHKIHGAPYASFVGSILLENALYLLIELLEKTSLKSAEKERILSLVDDYIGFSGMTGGQIMDMRLQDSDQSPGKKYINMIELKTSRLIELSINMACILSNADEVSYSRLTDYAKNIGILFQLIDDLLEVVGDEKTIGKSVKSDSRNKKVTAVSLFGKENVEIFADSLYFYAKKSVEHFGEKSIYLCEFAKFLRLRNK